MIKTPNEGQRQVINDLQNNIILFASAGTGKTFTVASRVANILAARQAQAEEILCLTFTIKASNEMKEDILAQVGAEAKDVQVHTIHGFCYRLIVEESKRTGGFSDTSVCDEVDQEDLLKSILSSRFHYWKLEQAFLEQNIPPVDLEVCEVCQGKNGDLYWCFQDKTISGTGEITSVDGTLSPAKILCPECGVVQRIKGRSCEVCGHEFVFRLAEKHFDFYTKKAGLRNLVSEIKHCREIQKFYSEDEANDYQRAFDYLQENDREKYESLISYYARFLGYAPDEGFLLAMQSFAGRLVHEYNEHLRLSNLLDFDDLIFQANKILNGDEGFSYWSNRYKYIIVDEMQDTSGVEYALLKKLFTKNNVMLCGDFFQTIYGWRGSNPQEILEDYIRTFSAKIYMLAENYRATKTLAQATFGYLKNTYKELVGRYCPLDLQIQSEAEGEKIFCYAFDNREEEAWQIYKYLLRQKIEDFSKVCIIARTNKYIAELSRYFEHFYLERGEKDDLRFFTVEENFQFFKKPLVKDVLAVLKLLLNPNDRVAMERLTEKYVRQVGIKTVQSLRDYNSIGVSICSFLNEQTYLYGDVYHSLIEGYRDSEIVVYDTETTGLNVEKDEIVQLSAIRLNAHGEIVDTLDILVEPTIPIETAAEETHGFTLEYIRANGGVTAWEALEKFSLFTQGCTLVGHNNLAYDKPLVERLLRENGLASLQIAGEYDTLLLAKQFFPQLRNYKLSTLCEHFSIVNECAHNALGDITATGKCLVRILEEWIIPTAFERTSILSKHAQKFERFFQFIANTRSRLYNGEEFAQYIVEQLRLQKRYATHGDYIAIRDIVESLYTEEMNKQAFLKEYLKDAALSGSQMDVLLAKTKKIPIITVHQAKGCEFDTVILAGADDSNFPSYAARQSGDEDEEKKVFYVAITRAKQRLILTRALRNGKHELEETPYFWQIPEEYVRVNQAWKNG